MTFRPWIILVGRLLRFDCATKALRPHLTVQRLNSFMGGVFREQDERGIVLVKMVEATELYVAALIAGDYLRSGVYVVHRCMLEESTKETPGPHYLAWIEIRIS